MDKSAFSISKLDTGIITTYGLYIVLSLLALIFVVFGSIFYDFNVLWTTPSRLLIIYLLTFGFVLRFNSIAKGA